MTYLLVSFHCYLRPLELLPVAGADVWVAADRKTTLMHTNCKGSRGPETVTADNPAVVCWVQRFKPAATAQMLQLQPQKVWARYVAPLAALGQHLQRWYHG